MQRWVNDYNMIDKIEYGYRPVLPFETKDVGAGVSAIKMEKPDMDYKTDQIKKQIKNDDGLGGKDLDNYIKDVKSEAIHIIAWKLSKTQLIVAAIKRLLGCYINKYINGILTKEATKKEFYQ